MLKEKEKEKSNKAERKCKMVERKGNMFERKDHTQLSLVKHCLQKTVQKNVQYLLV